MAVDSPFAIEIRDRYGKAADTIPAQSWTFTERLHDTGTWSVTVPTRAIRREAIATLNTGLLAGVALWDQRAKTRGTLLFSGVHDGVTLNVSANGDNLTIGGETDMSLLARRIIHPDPAKEIDQQTEVAYYKPGSGPAGVRIMDLVNASIGDEALPGRDMISSGVPLAIGTNVSINERLSGLLEAVAKYAAAGGVCLQLRWDGSRVVPVVYLPTTRDALLLSPYARGVVSWTASTKLPGANFAIVAGGGEGTERVLQVEQYTKSVQKWGRYEAVIDQRQSVDPAELEDAGRAYIAERIATGSVQVELSNLRYRDEFELGDYIPFVGADGEVATEQARAITYSLSEKETTPRLKLTVGASDRDVKGHAITRLFYQTVSAQKAAAGRSIL